MQIAADKQPCPNLVRLLADETCEKLFHFGRFDIAMLKQHIGPVTGRIFCTKIASKLCRTYTDRHGLSDLCRELLGLDISKQQQSSDWGADVLSPAQQDYAAGDVLYLHQLKDRLSDMLVRTGRLEMAEACFAFLQTRTDLDMAGFETLDIFIIKPLIGKKGNSVTDPNRPSKPLLRAAKKRQQHRTAAK